MPDPIRPIIRSDEARIWTAAGECPYPHFLFYLFTSAEQADHIRQYGFGDAASAGFVWLTRSPDRDEAPTCGEECLPVAVLAQNLLTALPNEAAEDVIAALGCGDEESNAECLRRHGYCGYWDSDSQRPWVGIIDPLKCRVVENHINEGAPGVCPAIGGA